MNETKQKNTGADTLLANWMKTATEFWGSMVRMWGDESDGLGSFKAAPAFDKAAGERVQESLQSALKTWRALSSVMSDPENLETQFKGVSTLPEILSKMVQTGWNGFFHLQRQWLKQTARVGESTEAYKFENLDRDAFKLWNELYQREFQQFLHIPQLGLTRFYQERMSLAVDEFNILQAEVAEFLHIFYLPMEKSFKVMQEKLSKMGEAGELPEDPKEYYHMWIKVLEGRYMTLFKSPEYTHAMSRALNALENYKITREKVIEDIVRMFPVPTQKDMDELYKEIYLLKKKVIAIEKEKVESLSR